MQKNINRFIVVVCSVALLNISLFFTVLGLLGIEYEGSESSNIYVFYIVLVAVLSFLAYGYATIVKGVLKRELFIILIILSLFSLHILWVIFDQPGTIIFPKVLIFFLLLALPGFFAAATIVKLNLVSQVIRFAEIIFIIMALGITVFSILPTFSGIRTASLAGASYQVLSYYSAFTFGMLLTYNIYLPRSLRLSWVSFSWYKGLSYGLILACILGCFIGGGRGAFILLITYILLTFLSVFMSKNNTFTSKEFFNIFIRLLVVISLFISFFSFFLENDFIQSGFSRATQFISSDGSIDIKEGSSGRDYVYQQAISYISERPLIGYGPFGFLDKTIQPHNLFLEILLQFGSIGFVFFLLLLVFLAIIAIKNWSVYNYWAFALLLYPLVMIMFSGSYMHTSEFIFGVTFLAINKINKPFGRTRDLL